MLKEHDADSARLHANILTVITRVLGKAPPSETISILANVQRTYLDAALSEIDKQYGAFDSDLNAANIDDNILNKVKAHLLDDQHHVHYFNTPIRCHTISYNISI